MAVTAACVLGFGAQGFGAEVPGWYSSSDLSFALAKGNSETLNLGLNAQITRKWLRTSWKTDANFVRTDVHEPTRRAVCTGTCDLNLAEVELGPTQTKSEKAFVNSAFERRVTERFFWKVAGNFERDKFAGLDSRTSGAAGVGYMWRNLDSSKTLQADVAATYTDQKEVVPDPETEDSFAGVRFTVNAGFRFGDAKRSAYTSQLVVDENAQDTDDLRANWQNSLSVEMNRRFSVKLNLQFAYDNQPQLVELALFRRNVGGNLVETPTKFPARAEKLDTSVSASIVVNFSPGGPVSRPGTN
ncbi:MAG TPA: DUF481 domain-containing protein [Vicinamibacteria bacterium]|nr:DUF481 domain-containing protein [Vicinamibacteria bacterium]